MNIAVRYFTRTGNTKKLADAIAAEVGAESFDVSVPLSEHVDILFLGSSVYGADVDGAVKQFISDNASNIGIIVNFSTAALLSSTYNQVKKIADKYSIPMAEEEFHCRGSFTVMHRNRPDQKDLQNSAKFAKNYCEKIQE